MKVCYKCKVEKENECFGKNNALKSGLCTYCKDCTKKIRKRLIARTGTQYRCLKPKHSIFEYLDPKEVMIMVHKVLSLLFKNKKQPSVQDMQDIRSICLLALCSSEYNPIKSVPSTFIYMVVHSSINRHRKTLNSKSRKLEVLQDEV